MLFTICCGITPKHVKIGSKIKWASNKRRESCMTDAPNDGRVGVIVRFVSWYWLNVVSIDIEDYNVCSDLYLRWHFRHFPCWQILFALCVVSPSKSTDHLLCFGLATMADLAKYSNCNTIVMNHHEVCRILKRQEKSHNCFSFLCFMFLRWTYRFRCFACQPIRIWLGTYANWISMNGQHVAMNFCSIVSAFSLNWMMAMCWPNLKVSPESWRQLLSKLNDLKKKTEMKNQ